MKWVLGIVTFLVMVAAVALFVLPAKAPGIVVGEKASITKFLSSSGKI